MVASFECLLSSENCSSLIVRLEVRKFSRIQFNSLKDAVFELEVDEHSKETRM